MTRPTIEAAAEHRMRVVALLAFIFVVSLLVGVGLLLSPA
jgi:hypothetical protein